MLLRSLNLVYVLRMTLWRAGHLWQASAADKIGSDYDFGANEKGATAVEYGLLAGLAALGVAGGLGAFADVINTIFDMLAAVTSDAADGEMDEGSTG